MNFPSRVPDSLTDLAVVANRLYVPSAMGTPIEIQGAKQDVVQSTGNRTLTPADQISVITSGSPTITLPPPQESVGRIYYIKNAGSGTVTVQGNNGETMDGETTIQLLQYDSLAITAIGGTWSIL